MSTRAVSAGDGHSPRDSPPPSSQSSGSGSRRGGSGRKVRRRVHRTRTGAQSRRTNSGALSTILEGGPSDEAPRPPSDARSVTQRTSASVPSSPVTQPAKSERMPTAAKARPTKSAARTPRTTLGMPSSVAKALRDRSRTHVGPMSKFRTLDSPSRATSTRTKQDQLKEFRHRSLPVLIDPSLRHLLLGLHAYGDSLFEEGNSVLIPLSGSHSPTSSRTASPSFLSSSASHDQSEDDSSFSSLTSSPRWVRLHRPDAGPVNSLYRVDDSLDDAEDCGVESPRLDYTAKEVLRKCSWNQSFQKVMDRLLSFDENTTVADKLDLYSELQQIAYNFEYTATTYGKIIIAERNVPMHMKTVRPVDLGGIAGGAKYTVQSILFKFATSATTRETFPDDESASKAAGHELKGLISYFNLGIDEVRYPMTLLLDYHGYRLVAIARLPISNPRTLVYGSADSGFHVESRPCPPEHNHKTSNFADLMRSAAKKLYLKPHVAGRTAKATMYSAVDLEGHCGLDGRFYCVDFARSFPPQERATKNHRARIYTHLFRPEMLRRYKTELNPDAMSPLIPCTSSAERKLRKLEEAEIKKANRFLRQLVEEFAVELSSQPLTSNTRYGVVEHMHRRGLNVRTLGRVRARVNPKSEWRMVLLVEMVARTIKQELRKVMRFTQSTMSRVGELQLKEAIVEHLNFIFGKWEGAPATGDEDEDNEDTAPRRAPSAPAPRTSRYPTYTYGNRPVDNVELYWTNLLKRVDLKFRKGISRTERKDALEDTVAKIRMWGTHPEVGADARMLEPESKAHKMLFARVCELLGLVFSRDVAAACERGSIYHLRMPFDASDIETLEPRIKRMNIVALAQGYTFKLKFLSLTNGEDRMRYCRKAISKFEEALMSLTNNVPVLLHLADLYMELAQYEKAQDLYMRAIEFDPGHAEALCKIALLHEVMGQADDADRYFQAALEARENYQNCLKRYADFLVASGRHEEGTSRDAGVLYERAIAMCDISASTYNSYACYLTLIKGDYGRAKEYWEKCLQLDPDHPVHISNYHILVDALERSDDGSVASALSVVARAGDTASAADKATAASAGGASTTASLNSDAGAGDGASPGPAAAVAAAAAAATTPSTPAGSPRNAPHLLSSGSLTADPSLVLATLKPRSRSVESVQHRLDESTRGSPASTSLDSVDQGVDAASASPSSSDSGVAASAYVSRFPADLSDRMEALAITESPRQRRTHSRTSDSKPEESRRSVSRRRKDRRQKQDADDRQPNGVRDAPATPSTGDDGA